MWNTFQNLNIYMHLESQEEKRKNGGENLVKEIKI